MMMMICKTILQFSTQMIFRQGYFFGGLYLPSVKWLPSLCVKALWCSAVCLSSKGEPQSCLRHYLSIHLPKFSHVIPLHKNYNHEHLHCRLAAQPRTLCQVSIHTAAITQLQQMPGHQRCGKSLQMQQRK